MDKLQAHDTFVRIVDRGSLTRAAEVARHVAAFGGAHPGGARARSRRAAPQPHDAPACTSPTKARLYLEQCRAILAAVRDADASLAARQRRAAGPARRHRARAVRPPARRADRHRIPRCATRRSMASARCSTARSASSRRASTQACASASSRTRRWWRSPSAKLRRVVCASPAVPAQARHPENSRGICASTRAYALPACARQAIGGSASATDARCPWLSRARFVTNQVDAAIAACEHGLGVGMFLSYQVAASGGASAGLRYVLTRVRAGTRAGAT